MISDKLARQLVTAAEANKIRPAGLLAFVEVETRGQPFEQDGFTPTLLYERHVAWREAKKVSKQVWQAFVKAGLAIAKWNKATQYKDQRKSAQKLALIAKARAVHEETANRSASWGLPQIMGFNAEMIGFPSATAMVEYQTGSVEHQIDCLIRFLREKGLIDDINHGAYKTVAKGYNGAGYAANQYDVKLADADKRWTRKLKLLPKAPVEKHTRAELIALQTKLRDLGYVEVGNPDGGWGTRTVGALSAFQKHEGLSVTGEYDDATKEALETALPREVSHERKATIPDDLKETSRTIQTAENVSLLGKIKLWVVGLFSTGIVGKETGVLDQAQDVVEKATQIKGMFEIFTPSPTTLVVLVLLAVSGVAIWWLANKITRFRTEDYVSGVHA